MKWRTDTTIHPQLAILQRKAFPKNHISVCKEPTILQFYMPKPMYNTNQRNNTYKSLLKYKQSRSSSTHYVICIFEVTQLWMFSANFTRFNNEKLRQTRPSNQINLKWMTNMREFVGLVGF